MERQEPCEPHECHWCGATIDHFIIYTDSEGNDVSWPCCPECKGN